MYLKKWKQIAGISSVIGVLWCGYYLYLNEFYKEENKQKEMLFIEITKKNAEMIEERLINNKLLLQRAVEGIDWSQIDSHDEAYKQMKLLKNTVDFEDIGLVTVNGEGCSYANWKGSIANEAFFKEILEGKSVIVEPLRNQTTGNMVITYGTPIVRGGRVSGAVIAQKNLEQLFRSNHKRNQDIHTILLSQNDEYLFHTNGETYLDLAEEKCYINGDELDQHTIIDLYHTVQINLEEVNDWKLTYVIPRNKMEYKKTQMYWSQFAITVIAIIILIGVLWSLQWGKKLKKMLKMRELANAMTTQALQIYYQPKMNIYTDQLIGAEALVRWKHPKKGMIYPNDFIPLAEKEGSIIQITQYVIRQVCKDLKKWQEEGYEVKPVSINFSRAEVYDDHILEYLMGQIEEWGIDKALIEIEITESVALKDLKKAKSVIEQYKKRGICVAMDDFGTGYATPKYIKYLPFDVIKIDKCLIDDIDNDLRSRQLLKGLIDVMTALQLKIIAEGVENKEQIECLKAMGIENVQGYFYSKPICHEDFMEKYLK